MSNDEKVYQKLLRAIVEHKLPPGVRLPEDKLSEAFGISRTGIRKALQRLAIERFVVIEPNKGAQVNKPSRKEAIDVLESRILIEPLLITNILKHWDDTQSCYFRSLVSEEHEAEHQGDLAASIHLTARFHYELARLSQNTVLAELIQQLCLRSSLVIAAFGSKSSVNCECGSHSEIIDLLDTGDLTQAQPWMAHHLERIKGSLSLDSQTEQPINFQQLFSEMEQ